MTTVTFADLRHHAPSIADPLEAKLRATGIALLATVRRDGSPRISPIEVSFQRESLYVGMMPGSMKSIDVERDPRACLLTPVRDKDDLGGEGKLFARIVRVADQALADEMLRAAADANGFDPELVVGSPFYEVRVEAAAWQHVDGDVWVTRSWRTGATVRERRRVGATGDAEEVMIGGDAPPA